MGVREESRMRRQVSHPSLTVLLQMRIMLHKLNDQYTFTQIISPALHIGSCLGSTEGRSGGNSRHMLLAN